MIIQRVVVLLTINAYQQAEINVLLTSICAAAGSAALGAVSFHVILVFASAVSRASPIWAVLVVVLACCSGAFSAGLHAIPCHVTGIGFALPHALPVLAVLAFIFALGDRTFRSAWINDH